MLKRSLLFVAFSLVLSVQVKAETSITLAVPLFEVAGEFGTKVTPSDYVSLSLVGSLSEYYGGNFSWVHSFNGNDHHWFGAGVGYVTTNSSNDFKISGGNYYSLDYKYFRNGLDNQGLYFFTTIRTDSDLVFPWVGIGYNW